VAGACRRLGARAKDDGSARYVSDLTHHNMNELVPHFQGTSEQMFLDWLRPNTFRATADLTKQYWQIPARVSQQRLMSFPKPHGDGYLQWRVLTMGAKGASRVGATMTALGLAVANARMLTDGFSYMDETAVQHHNQLMALLHQMGILVLFRYLGARINLPKSMTVPQQSILFIGLRAVSPRHQVAPAEKRLATIRQAAEAMQGPALPTKQQLASLVGRVRSLLRCHQTAGFRSARMSEALAQMVRLHGPLARSARMGARLHQWIQQELRFWAHPHPEQEWRFCPSAAIATTIVVDSSMYGWAGEVISRGPRFRTSGFFSAEQRTLWWHDTHECAGLVHTVLAWLQQVRPSGAQLPMSLLVGTDNITTMVAANKRRSKSLQVSALMADFIPVLYRQGFELSAFHINKEQMDSEFQVDARGRRRSSIWEWGLPRPLVAQICHHLGVASGRPLLDLFASQNVAQSPHFVSLEPNHNALWWDALSPASPPWNETSNPLIPERSLLYAFPPPRLLPQVFRRLRQDQPDSLLVVMPCFSTIPVWSQLLEFMRSPPAFLVLYSDELEPPEGRVIARTFSGQRFTFLAAILSPQSCGPAGWTRDLSGRPLRADGKVATLATMTLHGDVGKIGSWLKDWASSIFRVSP